MNKAIGSKIENLVPGFIVAKLKPGLQPFQFLGSYFW